ncbi:trypsin-like peptidase domain-containing protein [Candidatus Campbellbacteria bacterium]|nr:MAG: trypsin-like peptidase domain-containing protein [Candidatus Campbellbacteria bacterium]
MKLYSIKKHGVQIGVVVSILLVLIVGFFVAMREIRTSCIHVEEEVAQTRARISVLEQHLSDITGDTEALKTSSALRDEDQIKESALLKEKLGALSGHLDAQETQIEKIVTTTDVSSLVTQWSPVVYRAECLFRKTDSGDIETSKGSALLESTSLGTRFITSGHVLSMDGARLIRCTLSASGSDAHVVIDDSNVVISRDVDFGYGYIAENTVSMKPSQICADKPRIGDAVLILGYPAIGAKETITATEGIISGFDENYFTTSAKIERGNSGGAAIDIKRNCFFGLPTLVFTGKIESLARILPASAF